MKKQEIVAICLLLEDKRWNLSKALMDSWLETDFGDRKPIVVASATDLNEENRNELETILSGRIDHIIISVKFDGLVCRISNSYPVTAFRMGIMRDHVRMTAINETINADYLFWIDSDNQHEKDALTKLFKVIQSTKGKLKTETASGIYPIKKSPNTNEPESMPAYWASQSEDNKRRPMPLRPNKITCCGYNGFGCLLMTRKAAEEIDWSNYSEYRELRRDMLEAGYNTGFLGDDAFWFKKAEDHFGVPHYIDTSVLSKHWKDDQSGYFEYIVAKSFDGVQEILHIGEYDKEGNLIDTYEGLTKVGLR